jgi:hypothetical protein
MTKEVTPQERLDIVDEAAESLVEHLMDALHLNDVAHRYACQVMDLDPDKAMFHADEDEDARNKNAFPSNALQSRYYDAVMADFYRQTLRAAIGKIPSLSLPLVEPSFPPIEY